MTFMVIRRLPLSRLRALLLGAATILAGTVLLATPQSQQPPATQQPTDVGVTLKIGEVGLPPRLAILDFIALTNKPEIVEAAKTIGRVFRDDVEFEREFSLVPRDVIATVPAPTSMTDIPFDRWHEINVDGVVVGSVRELPARAGQPVQIHVEVKLYGVTSRQAVFNGAWEGVTRSARLFAHRAADDIHREQRGLQGVAQTKLTFNSDRDGNRVPTTVENRTAKEIYFADYDGDNQQRVTTGLNLNINSKWAPDGRAIVYASYKAGLPNIVVSRPFEGLAPQQLTTNAGNNFTPAYSPDGRKIAFSSNRAGNFDIYVMNVDGSEVHSLTSSTADDITPTWSPTGTQIAFTSSRGGTPQVYVMDADGLNQRPITRETGADRATWSPAPLNEIAYSATTGPGQDIKVYEVSTGRTRQLTNGEGSNESPAFAPNGRHIAFTSTRAGKEQVFVMHRDGTGIKQLTTNGNNRQPDWSTPPPAPAATRR